MLLYFSFLILILGLIIVKFLPQHLTSYLTQIALSISSVLLILSIYMIKTYDSNYSYFQHVFDINLYTYSFFNIKFFFGLGALFFCIGILYDRYHYRILH